jgi:hypothetical protein
MAEPVNVNDLLDGHVALDLECLDRVYLNAYVPNLQVSGQVVTFLTEHLGNPVPSPALFNRIGAGFRKAVAAFAEANDVPVVRFAKGDRKADVMRPYLAAAPSRGWWRSAWPRSFSRCSPAMTVVATAPGRPASRSRRPTGG